MRADKYKKIYQNLYYPETSDLSPVLKEYFKKHPYVKEEGKWKYAVNRFLKNTDSVCEVGCGRGKFLFQLKTTGRKYGVDIVKPPSIKDITFFEAPAWQIPLGDKSVDYVLSFAMLEHLYPEDVSPTLKEWARVARKGFLFYITTLESGNEMKQIQDAAYPPYHFTLRPWKWWIEQVLEHTFAMHYKMELLRQRRWWIELLMKYKMPAYYKHLAKIVFFTK